MDVDARTWRYRPLIDSGVLAGPPHPGFGRPMKVGKEAIVGLLVALRRFVAADDAAELARQGALLERIVDRLAGQGIPDDSGWPAVTLRRPPVDGRIPYPVLAVDFGGAAAADRAAALVRALQAGDPPVYVGEGWLDLGQIGILASTLVDSEADMVARAVAGAVATVRTASEAIPIRA
jgi:L-seryl-tRNA(Ser) seleniumtransferase